MELKPKSHLFHNYLVALLLWKSQFCFVWNAPQITCHLMTSLVTHLTRECAIADLASTRFLPSNGKLRRYSYCWYRWTLSKSPVLIQPKCHRKQLPLFLCLQSPQEQTPPSVLAALANGFAEREQEPAEPTHKIRVDFKVDNDPPYSGWAYCVLNCGWYFLSGALTI